MTRAFSHLELIVSELDFVLGTKFSRLESSVVCKCVRKYGWVICDYLVPCKLYVEIVLHTHIIWWPTLSFSPSFARVFSPLKVAAADTVLLSCKSGPSVSTTSSRWWSFLTGQKYTRDHQSWFLLSFLSRIRNWQPLGNENGTQFEQLENSAGLL